MADSIGQLEPRLAMQDFLGADRFLPPGAVFRNWRGADGTTVRAGASISVIAAQVITKVPYPDTFQGVVRCGDGVNEPRWDLADVWFDQALVRPLAFSFGNILSTQTETITVYSSYRNQVINLITVVNNLGVGVNLPDLPSLPRVLEPQSGFEVTLQVTTDGSPSLNDTIDWTFDVGTQMVTITGQRIVMFPLRPEVPMTERLGFLTNVLEHIDGSEQRIADREHPRQEFEFELALDTTDRQFVNNLLFDWQSRVFGVPVWTDPVFSTVQVNNGQLQVPVTDTSTSDFRVGGLAIVLTDRFVFDALEIAAVGSNTITFTSPLNNTYSAGTQVLPLRVCVASPMVRGSQAPIEDEELRLRFRCIENNVGAAFADASAFNTFNGKVLLDGPNATERRMTVALRRRLIEFNNQIGTLGITSPWSRGKRSAVKGFVTNSRSDLWDVRRLLHELKGRQQSFWLPTFQNELTLTLPLAVGANTMNVVNVGFSQFAKQRSPSRVFIRVDLVDGTRLLRTVTNSGEFDASVEVLTLSETWAEEIPIEDVARIDYLEQVRFDADDIEIRHNNADGSASLFVPVISVFE